MSAKLYNIAIFIEKIILSLIIGVFATIVALILIPIAAILMICYIPSAAVEYVWHGNRQPLTPETDE